MSRKNTKNKKKSKTKRRVIFCSFYQEDKTNTPTFHSKLKEFKDTVICVDCIHYSVEPIKEDERKMYEEEYH